MSGKSISSGITAHETALRLAGAYSAMPAVEALVLSGSRTSGVGDPTSDIDLYVYSHEPVSLKERAEVASGARRAEIGNAFWEPGDEWVDQATGISVDDVSRLPMD